MSAQICLRSTAGDETAARRRAAHCCRFTGLRDPAAVPTATNAPPGLDLAGRGGWIPAEAALSDGSATRPRDTPAGITETCQVATPATDHQAFPVVAQEPASGTAARAGRRRR
ncbi:hypothetical protein [Kitasatospora sp. NE20-6]|uniref:hypothetical protein n=1 Tax=Kitasatospora sp. NE20-6 TaxID=2859066 RepID=UPI0038B305F6